MAETIPQEAVLLDEWARGPLSDAILRARSQEIAETTAVDVRTVTTRRAGRRRDRVVRDEVLSTGVHVWLLDESTAVALARGGLLLRGEDRVFAPVDAAELAVQRCVDLLRAYLGAAEALLAATSVSRGAQTWV